MEKEPLSPEAQKWHDLIGDVHQAEQGNDTPERSLDEPQHETSAEYHHDLHRARFQTALQRLARTTGGKLGAAFALLSFLIALAVIASFSGGDAKSTPLNDGGDAAPKPSVTRPDDAATGPSEVVDADDATPLSGTWVMFWRNSQGSENAAFTLRFNGSNTGNLEVLNDDNESETWFELEDDVLSFGFTRTFEAPTNWPAGNPFPPDGWPENSTFEGDRDSDGNFLGKWYRDDWECSPDVSPPCSYNLERTFFSAWLEREP